MLKQCYSSILFRLLHPPPSLIRSCSPTAFEYYLRRDSILSSWQHPHQYQVKNSFRIQLSHVNFQGSRCLHIYIYIYIILPWTTSSLWDTTGVIVAVGGPSWLGLAGLSPDAF